MIILYYKKDNIYYTLLLMLVITLFTLPAISGCNDEPTDYNEKDKSKSGEKIDENKAEDEEEINETTELTISAVGDIMVHDPQLDAQYDHETDKYDFKDNFQHVTSHIQNSDLALANLETVLAGEEEEFTGFPLFNSPDALADALKQAGFHVLSTANNHSLDRDKPGIKRTVEVIEDRGMKAIGTRKNTDKKSYIIKEIEGVDIGLSAYTYETPRYNNQRTINGIPMSEEVNELVDSFNPEELDNDMNEMVERVELLQDEEVDLVVFFLHWGQEYQRYPDEYQKKIAQELVENGVDVIFGSHPHVIQPVDKIKTDSGKRGIIINSMGNFLSNQRSKYLNNPYTEDGIIFHIDILSDGDEEVSIDKVSYTPTWVHRFQEDGQRNYSILPLPHALEDKEEYGLYNETDIERAERAWDNTRSILEEGSYEPELLK
ncbi:CapA family protein [Natranaerofaba carboxydovora]|uniref:CapA family protein n=1 Tax=Natranaerofaba carboxydovora TaxID=2742683 RepID=UPI001F138685|nr:CapA family protein [Natranaerofaba carboxydovora]UMZ74350.1 Capsule biosynthesis protein CapA [Natranaerofaba carboxydovora]